MLTASLLALWKKWELITNLLKPKITFITNSIDHLGLKNRKGNR
jgi:hypothetical protein